MNHHKKNGAQGRSTNAGSIGQRALARPRSGELQGCSEYLNHEVLSRCLCYLPVTLFNADL